MVQAWYGSLSVNNSSKILYKSCIYSFWQGISSELCIQITTSVSYDKIIIIWYKYLIMSNIETTMN
jgi:hypothetical protein